MADMDQKYVSKATIFACLCRTHQFVQASVPTVASPAYNHALVLKSVFAVPTVAPLTQEQVSVPVALLQVWV